MAGGLWRFRSALGCVQPAALSFSGGGRPSRAGDEVNEFRQAVVDVPQSLVLGERFFDLPKQGGIASLPGLGDGVSRVWEMRRNSGSSGFIFRCLA